LFTDDDVGRALHAALKQAIERHTTVA